MADAPTAVISIESVALGVVVVNTNLSLSSNFANTLPFSAVASTAVCMACSVSLRSPKLPSPFKSNPSAFKFTVTASAGPPFKLIEKFALLRAKLIPFVLSMLVAPGTVDVP